MKNDGREKVEGEVLRGKRVWRVERGAEVWTICHTLCVIGRGVSDEHFVGN